MGRRLRTRACERRTSAEHRATARRPARNSNTRNSNSKRETQNAELEKKKTKKPNIPERRRPGRSTGIAPGEMKGSTTMAEDSTQAELLAACEAAISSIVGGYRG